MNTAADFDAAIDALTAEIDAEIAKRNPLADTIKRLRKQFADKLLAWQLGRPKVTHEMLVREMIESEAKRKQALKDRGLPVDYVGPAPEFQTAVDATAYYGPKGNRSVGGGPAFRRGATTRRNMKLPSQR